MWLSSDERVRVEIRGSKMFVTEWLDVAGEWLSVAPPILVPNIPEHERRLLIRRKLSPYVDVSSLREV
jgi:hypothetical protein